LIVMNVLITGGAGFIGYHLARFHAERGDSVLIFDNFFKKDGRPGDREFSDLEKRANVRVVELDLTKPVHGVDAPKEIGIVYHLAAVNGTRLFYEIPYTVARTNLLATLNLLDWLEGKTLQGLLYTSSSETYADGEKLGLVKIPTDETVPVAFSQPTPVRFSYGTSKFMGEFLCFQFGRTFGVPASVVRYHNIYGPRMGYKHVIPEFTERLRRQERPFRIYGADQTRAFCYVDDAVEATHAVAADPRCDGEIVHIGNSTEEVSMRDLARTMMRLFDAKWDIEEHPCPDASVKRRCPDTTKLRELTGFVAKHNLEDGLRKTMDWYLSQQPPEAAE